MTHIITAANDYQELDRWIGQKKVFLVCDSSLQFLTGIREHLNSIEQRNARIVRFSRFQPNPLYESVVNGVNEFLAERCDAIMAIGGGSAIDVAKCIKLFSNMNHHQNYLEQTIIPNDIPFLAMPTTAGTGSEATRYAVIYYHGAKQSVMDPSCIPETVLMDSSVLETLPLYQKKSTMLDALCHAIESFWSVNSTEESKEYSRDAIRLVMRHMDGYLANTEEGNAGMLLAANLGGGKAINIAQTTAGHAMCYKITSLYGCAHGHAAMLCVRKLFPWMVDHTEDCIDPRGKQYIKDILDEIGRAMGCENALEAARKLQELFCALEMSVPSPTAEQYEMLKTSVNPIRLKNHPILLDERTIDLLYHEMLR